MAEKQLYVIDDFTGSMNSEADASDLQPNESLILENIYPSGKGKLVLARERCTVAAQGASVLHDGTTALTDLDAVYSFKDTMGLLDIAATKDATLHVLYSSGPLYTTKPVMLAAKTIHSHGSYLPKVTKSHFISYNGITRMGCEGYQWPCTVITNFGRTNSLSAGSAYVNRERFASANYKVGADAGSHGIAIFGDSLFCGSVETGYTDRGCGVYPPDLATVEISGAKSNYTYGAHSIGVYIAESGASSNDSEYIDNDQIWYGFSFEYDYNQESPMVVLGNKKTPSFTVTGGDQYYPTIKLFVTGGTPATDPGWWTDLTSAVTTTAILDERITAINMYRKINDGEFYHVAKFSVVGDNKVIDDNGVPIGWAYDSGYWSTAGTSGELYADFGKYSVDTYYSHSGFSDYIELVGDEPIVSTSRFFIYGGSTGTPAHPMLNWNIGCMFRNMSVVSATYVWDNGFPIVKPHKRIHVSMPDKPDTFHPDHWFIVGDHDSSPFKCIQPLGIDRIAFFDANNTYILNAASIDPLGWYVEHTYNVGIGNGNSWAALPEGLAFANAKGVYVLDFYGKLVEISRKIRTTWATIGAVWTAHPAVTYGYMHYDRKTDVLYIAKTGLDDNYGGLQFDLESGAWSWWSDDVASGSLGNDVIDKAMGLFQGYNNETHLAWINTNTDKIGCYTVMAPASGISIRQRYQSPHIDLGTSGIVKTGKHLYVKYASGVALAVTIYIDGSSTGVSLGTLAASSTLTTGHLRIPYRFRTLSVKVETNAYNSGVFQIDEIAIEFKHGRAK